METDWINRELSFKKKIDQKRPNKTAPIRNNTPPIEKEGEEVGKARKNESDFFRLPPDEAEHSLCGREAGGGVGFDGHLSIFIRPLQPGSMFQVCRNKGCRPAYEGHGVKRHKPLTVSKSCWILCGSPGCQDVPLFALGAKNACFDV